MSDNEPAPMSAKMRRFLANPPKRLAAETVVHRRTNAVRRGKPRGLLDELCEAQGWRCAYCSRSMRRKERADKPWLTATVDHILPVSRGGTNARWNVTAACKGCNTAKADMTADEFRAASVDSRRMAETACGLGSEGPTSAAAEGQTPLTHCSNRNIPHG
jgi:hypothetical protein